MFKQNCDKRFEMKQSAQKNNESQITSFRQKNDYIAKPSDFFRKNQLIDVKDYPPQQANVFNNIARKIEEGDISKKALSFYDLSKQYGLNPH